MTITAGLVAIVIVAGLCLAYWRFPGMRDVIVFAAAATAAAGTVVSSFYASATIRQSAQLQALAGQDASRAAAQARDAETAAATRFKVAAAQRLIERWNDPMFSGTLIKWREQRQLMIGSSAEATRQRLADDLASRAVVQEILNRLEEIAIIVLGEGAEEKLLRNAIQPILNDVSNVCKSWIEKNQLNDPLAWTQLQELQRKWLKS